MLLPSYVVDNGWMILTLQANVPKVKGSRDMGCARRVYGSNWYVDATLDAWEDPKTSTSCPEAWHTIEDILEGDFDAITLVPHE